MATMLGAMARSWRAVFFLLSGLWLAALTGQAADADSPSAVPAGALPTPSSSHDRTRNSLPLKNVLTDSAVADATAETSVLRDLKKRANTLLVDAERLEAAHGPELLITHSRAFSRVEAINREILAGRMPRGERWQLGVVAEFARFDLEVAGNLSATLRRVWLHSEFALTPKVHLWNEIGLYETEHDTGAQLGGGVTWSPQARYDFSVYGRLWEAWDDNTLAVWYDGHKHDLTVQASWQIARRLRLAVDGTVAWYSLGDTAAAGGYYGYEWDGGGRADVNLFRREKNITGRGFYDRFARQNESIEQRVDVFIAYRRSQFDFATTTRSVSVITDSVDERIGIEWRQPLAPRWGFIAAAYLGRDQHRNIDWPDLYGWRGRVEMTPHRRVRVWADYELNSESGGGIEAGRTQTFSVGLNLNF